MSKSFLSFCSAAALAVAASFVSSCGKEFDPSYLENELSDLKGRVEKLEQSLKNVNSDIQALQTIVNGLGDNVYVTSFSPTANGYDLTLSSGEHLVIKNGTNAAAPVIGVKAVDGVYYWTVNGEFILDAAGNKMPVTGPKGDQGDKGDKGDKGENGNNGENGKDAVAPVIGVKESDGVLYWTVNGEFLLDANGNKVRANGEKGNDGVAGDSFFKSIVVKSGEVVFTLADGTEFALPFRQAAKIRVEASKLHFDDENRSKNVHIHLENINGATLTYKPEGWKASLKGCEITITAPASWTVDNGDADGEGYVTVLATSGDQTFIGKILVTVEAPVFEMGVTPTGMMTIEQKDYDLQFPGFWASFVEAERFNPEDVTLAADLYSPQMANADQFYTSWTPAITGDYTFRVAIDTCLTTNGKMYPEAQALTPGKRYAAYCFPGCYSKGVTVNANPDNVYVKYITYVTEEFAASNITTTDASISLTINGTNSIYGGILAIGPDTDMNEVKAMFLADAEPAISNQEGGEYGHKINGNGTTRYNGKLSLYGSPASDNAWNLVPGNTYAIAALPIDGERIASEYTIDDVIINTVQLNAPSASGRATVTITEGYTNFYDKSVTPISSTYVGVTFTPNAAAVKAYYHLVKSENIEGMSDKDLYSYVLTSNNTAVWDSSINGSGDGKQSLDLNNLDPGTECCALAVAFDSDGNYTLTKCTVSSLENSISSAVLKVTATVGEWRPDWMDGEVHPTMNRITFSTEGSDASIKKIRRYYTTLTKKDFEKDWTDAEIYNSLCNTMYDYNEANVTGDPVEDAAAFDEAYINTTGYKDDNDTYIAFFIGVDAAGAYTELVKVEYVPSGKEAGEGEGDAAGYVASTDPGYLTYAPELSFEPFIPASWDQKKHKLTVSLLGKAGASYSFCFVPKADYDNLTSIADKVAMVDEYKSFTQKYNEIKGEDYAEFPYEETISGNVTGYGTLVGEYAYLVLYWIDADGSIYEPYIVGTSDVEKCDPANGQPSQLTFPDGSTLYTYPEAGEGGDSDDSIVAKGTGDWSDYALEYYNITGMNAGWEALMTEVSIMTKAGATYYVTYVSKDAYDSASLAERIAMVSPTDWSKSQVLYSGNWEELDGAANSTKPYTKTCMDQNGTPSPAYLFAYWEANGKKYEPQLLAEVKLLADNSTDVDLLW